MVCTLTGCVLILLFLVSFCFSSPVYQKKKETAFGFDVKSCKLEEQNKESKCQLKKAVTGTVIRDRHRDKIIYGHNESSLPLLVLNY